MLILSPTAFLPRKPLSAHERSTFIEQRDRLFALCTPAEQAYLIELAQWYGAQRERFLMPPNLLSDSHLATVLYRILPHLHAKPTVTVRCLAQCARLIHRIEARLGMLMRRRLFARLDSLRRGGQEELLMGVANYLRTVPLQLNWCNQGELEKELELIVRTCASNQARNPIARIHSLIRTIQATPDHLHASKLCAQIWPLLLEVAEQDIAVAIAVIDAHWEVTKSAVLQARLPFHEDPGLAYRVAMIFQPHRPYFASAMMRESVVKSSYLLAKMEGTARDALVQIMDASCRMLASWIAPYPPDAWAASLSAIGCLLQHGNPADGYWTTLPGTALAILNAREHEERRPYFRLMAQITFYSDSGSAQESACLELFHSCAERALGMTDDVKWAPKHAVADFCDALSILEDKTLSFRNRRIQANPRHPLLGDFAMQLKQLLARVIEREPASSLQNVVTLVLQLSNEILIRQWHEALRKQFAQRAAAFPADGGQALHLLIKYCQYSQFDDEMYRRDVCKESFDLLIPVLDAISPADAAFARSGSRWSPRDGNF